MDFSKKTKLFRFNRYILTILTEISTPCNIIVLVIFSAILFSSGCTRQFYKTQTDAEAYALLSCASSNPRWKLDDYRIDVDCRSRMFDPYNPNDEPMPPDDPAAQNKMRKPGGMKGSKKWGEHGYTNQVENPCWRNSLLLNSDGEAVMDKDGAFDLALLHSPEYQTALENLYLSALNVSQQRFNFDVQFFGKESLFYTANGKLRGDSITLRQGADIGFEKKLATGGQIVADLANSVTWSFGGEKTWGAETLLNIGLVQPLLRNAGRKIVLENLTQTERDFLAALRQMVYFQQGFYTKIVTGQTAVSMQPGTIRASYTPASSSGFYGLLAEQIRIQNQQQNIVRLEDNLERFREVFNAGQMSDRYQVEQTKQNLLTSQSALLQRIGSYKENTETYLRSFGLPPDLKVKVSDPLMEEFQMTSPSMTTLEGELMNLLSVVRRKNNLLPEQFLNDLKSIVKNAEGEITILYNDLSTLEKSVPKRLESLKVLEGQLAQQIKDGERYDPSIFRADDFTDRIKTLKEVEIPKNIRRLRCVFRLIDLIAGTDEDNLRRILENEQFADDTLDALHILNLVSTSFKLEDELVKTLHNEEASAEPLKKLREEYKRIRTLRRVLKGQSDDETAVEKIVEEVQKEQDTGIQTESQKIVAELREKDIYRDWIRRVLSVFQNEMVTLSILQTRTRLDAIVLVPTEISPEDAFHIASENRLDWMNQKAALVDSWRKIDIAANRLRGELNVTVNGSLGTVDQKGIRFDRDNSTVRVGLEWDTPLTRHSEMLDYRRAQIAYQAARRNYYSFVDSVNAELRNILREIKINMVEFEIKRNAILVAATRVDIMQLRMDQPPARNSKIDTNTADQLISALDGLMTSQNNFLNVWVSYQTQRMLLDLKIGTMQLDEKGRWIDPGTITKERVGTPAKYGPPYGSGAYSGVFASDAMLKPSHSRSNGFMNRYTSVTKNIKQTSAGFFSDYEENEKEVILKEQSPKTIPAAPRLEPEIKPEATPELKPEPKAAPKLSITEPKIAASTVEVQKVASANHSPLAPDTLPKHPPKPLSRRNAPPPPKTLE
ncbi:MAG: hypothetical protein FWE67_08855 [Planctomycetaceae bacterium]|nr:hypothetical protein [Planctomycetaceae bacterium]